MVGLAVDDSTGDDLELELPSSSINIVVVVVAGLAYPPVPVILFPLLSIVGDSSLTETTTGIFGLMFPALDDVDAGDVMIEDDDEALEQIEDSEFCRDLCPFVLLTSTICPSGMLRLVVCLSAAPDADVSVVVVIADTVVVVGAVADDEVTTDDGALTSK